MLTNDQAAQLVQGLEPGTSREDAVKRYWTLWHSDAAMKRLDDWGFRLGDTGLRRMRGELLPALMIVEEKFRDIPRQWTKAFVSAQSKVDIERSVDMRLAGLPQLRPYGSEAARDTSVGERYVYNFPMNDLALEIAFKHESDGNWLTVKGHKEGAITQEDEFSDVLGTCMLGLANSFSQAQEIVHANVLNTGNTYNGAIVGDGRPLFDERHPIDQPPSYYGNRYAFDLNVAALEFIHTRIRELPDQAGLRLLARSRMLVVPAHLELVAQRVMTGVRQENPSVCPEGYCVLDFLTNPRAWFVLSSIHGLRSFEKKPFALDLKIEGGDVLVLEGSQSYACGHSNPRAVVASYEAELRK